MVCVCMCMRACVYGWVDVCADVYCTTMYNDSYLISTCTVKLVYSNTLGATKMCCYNQVVVVTRTFSTETTESVPAMCVVIKSLML